MCSCVVCARLHLWRATRVCVRVWLSIAASAASACLHAATLATWIPTPSSHTTFAALRSNQFRKRLDAIDDVLRASRLARIVRSGEHAGTCQHRHPVAPTHACPQDVGQWVVADHKHRTHIHLLAMQLVGLIAKHVLSPVERHLVRLAQLYLPQVPPSQLLVQGAKRKRERPSAKTRQVEVALVLKVGTTVVERHNLAVHHVSDRSIAAQHIACNLKLPSPRDGVREREHAADGSLIQSGLLHLRLHISVQAGVLRMEHIRSQDLSSFSSKPIALHDRLQLRIPLAQHQHALAAMMLRKRLQRRVHLHDLLCSQIKGTLESLRHYCSLLCLTDPATVGEQDEGNAILAQVAQYGSCSWNRDFPAQ
mmetsp:Transcript_19935/g.63401  ORF Transcript_19935/g.63401 Transcript_19935/m.63401 type:complete len:365 (-) Transcript_19935:82-1176(-)